MSEFCKVVSKKDDIAFLFLCKRRPMGRDLLTRPYGRFYHLPRLLARKGHEVAIILCSYKREPDECDFYDDDGIRWYSVSLVNLNPFRYYRKTRQLAREIRPDWIGGFSNTYYGLMACRRVFLFLTALVGVVVCVMSKCLVC